MAKATTGQTKTPVLLVTPGDPAGVGPEVMEAALRDSALSKDVEYRRIGDWERGIPGQPDRASAEIALDALEAASKALTNGEAQGVVTGPVCKHRMQEIGFTFPGQTEFFAARAGVEDFAMLLTGGQITVALVTAHVPLAAVPALVTQSEIIRIARLLHRFLKDRGLADPRIAVAGLNPHAGENGDLGREELEVIEPAISKLAREMKVEGPIPPDTLFFRLSEGTWDAALAMYHDQGLIPLKLHAFDRGVNVTLGLPFIRTSPDHGTAFDIAGRHLARHDSALSALNLAAEMAIRKSLEI